MNNLLFYIIFISLLSCLYHYLITIQSRKGYRSISVKFGIIICYLAYIVLATQRKIELIGITDNALIHTGGVDAYHAKVVYEAYGNDWNALVQTHSEIGYKVLMFLCYKINSDFRFFIFVYHSIAFIIMDSYFKRSDVKNSLIYTVLIVGLLFTMFNTMRHNMVTLLWLNILDLYRRGNTKLSVGLALISITIHKVAIFGIFVLFVISIGNYITSSNNTKIVVMLLLGPLFSIIGREFLLPMLEGTSDIGIYVTSDSISYNIYIFLALILMVIAKEYKSIVQYRLIQDVEYYIVIIVFCLSLILIQSGFKMTYRIITLFIGSIYEICSLLISKVLYRNSLEDLACKALLYGILLYKVYTLYFIELNSGQIV